MDYWDFHRGLAIVFHGIIRVIDHFMLVWWEILELKKKFQRCFQDYKKLCGNKCNAGKILIGTFCSVQLFGIFLEIM